MKNFVTISITKVYCNEGSGFREIGAPLLGGGFGSAAWGDDDADGDLDISLVGQSPSGRVALVYRNTSETMNTIPAVSSKE